MGSASADQIRFMQSTIDNCLRDLISITDLDLVVSRLDILHQLLSEGSWPEPIWAVIQNKIEQVQELLIVEISQPGVLQVGRPTIHVSMENVEYLLSLKFKATKIAQMLGISRRTLHRRMSLYGISVSLVLF